MPFLDELKQYPQWVVRASDKIPWRVDGARPASPTNPADWSTYEQAAALCAQYPDLGLGFVLADSDPFTCIDLDPTEDPAVIKSQAEIFNAFDSYTERSPSGRGAHIWVKGKVPTRRLAAKKIEVYSTQHYMTVTFDAVQDKPVADRQHLLEDLINSIDAAQNKKSGPAIDTQPQVNSDEQIYKMALQAANGDKFYKLWNGDFVSDYPSHSEADMALCNILAFYTDNKQQVARMWVASPLGQSQPKHKRPKWVMDMVNKSFDQKVAPIDPVVAAKLTAQIKEQLQTQKVEESAYQDWTLPPGMVGQIAQFIYAAAPSPIKEVALAGAIAFYAGLMGRSYNVSGMGLNQYIVVLAPTGSGKEAAKSGISKICNGIGGMLGDNIEIDWFIGPEMIASAQGLLNRMADNPCCVSILPEFGKLLNELCDPRAPQNSRNILAAFLKLYSSSGKAGRVGTSAYSDRAKNAKTIESPAFSILGESNQVTFYRAVNEMSVSDGFLPRLTLIEYNGDCPEPNEKAHFVQPDANMLLLLQGQIRQNQSTEALREVINVAYSPEAEQYQKNLRKKCRLAVDEHNKNNEIHFSEIWTRVHAKVVKLAALIAVGVNSLDPTISLHDIQWADDLVTRGVGMLTARFKAGDVGASNYQFEQTQLMEKQLRSYISAEWSPRFEKNYLISEEQKNQGIVHFQYINANLRTRPAFKESPNMKMAFNSTLELLVDAGKLVAIKDNEVIVRNGRTGKMWRIVGL